MIARPFPARTPEEIARLVRALGSHRYVAGRLLLVHAFVFDALADARDLELTEACVWAAGVLAAPDVDPTTRDERLHRRANEREVGAILAALWGEDDRGERARDRLRARLEAIGEGARQSPPFDESAEDEAFPALIDAGWELLPLAALDPERHRGAIEAFGDPVAFARAVRAASLANAPHLHELPLFGPAELLHGAEHVFRNGIDLWTEGDETYDAYVLRGVLRAAKLD